MRTPRSTHITTDRSRRWEYCQRWLLARKNSCRTHKYFNGASLGSACGRAHSSIALLPGIRFRCTIPTCWHAAIITHLSNKKSSPRGNELYFRPPCQAGRRSSPSCLARAPTPTPAVLQAKLRSISPEGTFFVVYDAVRPILGSRTIILRCPWSGTIVCVLEAHLEPLASQVRGSYRTLESQQRRAFLLHGTSVCPDSSNIANVKSYSRSLIFFAGHGGGGGVLKVNQRTKIPVIPLLQIVTGSCVPTPVSTITFIPTPVHPFAVEGTGITMRWRYCCATLRFRILRHQILEARPRRRQCTRKGAKDQACK